MLEAEAPGPELAAAHANLAMLALNDNDIETGFIAAGQALDLAERCGDRNVLVHALNTRGMLELLAGEQSGRAALEQSLEISLAEGRDDHVGRAYVHLADIAQRHRDWSLHRPLLRRRGRVLQRARLGPLEPLPPGLLRPDRARSGPVG